MKKVFFGLTLFLNACVSTTSMLKNSERAPASVSQGECLQVKGLYNDQNKQCICGSRSIFPSYEACEVGKIIPAKIQQIIELEGFLNQKEIIDGYEYIWIYKPLLVKFPQRNICYGELSVGRINDDRIMPGGSGPRGGRIACSAAGDSCPPLKDCLAESQSVGNNSELTSMLWEIHDIYRTFGPFKNHNQLIEDQNRGTFTCYHPQTKQTKIFQARSQHEACSSCMFFGRDEAKVSYPYGCSICDSPEAIANRSARKCSADGI